MSPLEAILLRLLASFVPGLCTFFRFAFVKRQIHSELYNRFDAPYFTWGLPLVLVLWMTMAGLLRFHGIPILLSLLVHLLLTLFAYTLLMWVLTPLLRRKINAGGCAALWGLQSVAIYYCMLLSVVKNYIIDVALLPLIKLRLSANALRIGLGIWFLGFLLVLGWKIWSHLRFRRGLLRTAAPFSPREEGLFSEAQAQLYVKTAFAERRLKLQFYRSPAADTPLSIGLFRKTTCFVLPQREYSDQELRLIFRHEIIHLLHEDNRLKFTLTVLCAAGWFVPGLWAGIGKAAEEEELACDEFATGGLSPEDRQNYASLLLDAVSPAEGFTTCLSAAASGLKYRLGRVLHPQRMASGRLAAVLLTLILVFMFGSVGFSIRVGTIGSRVLSGDGGDWHVTEVTSSSDQPCRDLQAVEDYLSNLEIEKPLWEEPLVVNGGDVILTLERPGGETKRISFSLDGTALYLADASDSAFQAQYLLVTPVDMNRLRTLAGGAA